MTDVDVITLDVPATHRYLNVVGACVCEMIHRFDDIADLEAVVHDIQLAVHEICANIVDHAYGGGENGRIFVELSYEVGTGKMIVRLRDRGRVFNPNDVVKPRFDEPQVRGFGLYLTHQIMDVVKYKRIADENTWYLEKTLS